jgi:hypothetical protein
VNCILCRPGKITKKIPGHPSVSGKGAPPFNACKINGRVNMHENDVIATQRDELMQTSHGMDFKSRREKLAAVHFTVEEIYDETPDIKAAGRQIT